MKDFSIGPGWKPWPRLGRGFGALARDVVTELLGVVEWRGEKMEKCALEDPGCIALGLGCLPDRVAHTARSDHVIRLPRFSAPASSHVTPLGDNLDSGETSGLTTERSTVMGTSIYKIVILAPKPDPVSSDNQHIVISDDCQGFEVEIGRAHV